MMHVPLSRVRMVSRQLMVSSLVMLRCFAVVFRGMLKVFRCFVMMFCRLL